MFVIKAKVIILLLIALTTTACVKNTATQNMLNNNAKDYNYSIKLADILNTYKSKNINDFYYADNKYVLIQYFDDKEGRSYFHIYNRVSGDYDEFSVAYETEVIEFKKNRIEFITWVCHAGTPYGHIPKVVTYSRDEELLGNENDFIATEYAPKEFQLNEKFEMKYGKVGKLIDIDINKKAVQFTFGPPDDNLSSYFAAAAFFPPGSIEYIEDKQVLLYRYKGIVGDDIKSKLQTDSILQPITEVTIENDKEYTNIYLHMNKTIIGEEKFACENHEQKLSYYVHYKETLVGYLPIIEIEWKTD